MRGRRGGTKAAHPEPTWSNLGMAGGGTLEEVAAFMLLVVDVRLAAGRPIGFVLVHHENKAGEISGAWEGEPDTLIHVRSGGRGVTLLTWQKVRWGSTLHASKWTLRWIPESEGFELVDDGSATATGQTAVKVAEAGEWLVGHVIEHPGLARSRVEKDYVEAHGGKGRNIIRKAIQAELEVASTPRLATRPGRAANGTYLYPASEARSPLATVLFGEGGDQRENLPRDRVLASSPPPKGEGELLASGEGGDERPNERESPPASRSLAEDTPSDDEASPDGAGKTPWFQ